MPIIPAILLKKPLLIATLLTLPEKQLQQMASVKKMRQASEAMEKLIIYFGGQLDIPKSRCSFSDMGR